MSTLIDLEKPKHIVSRQAPWKACLPFVENSRGVLIHRPRSGSTYSIHKRPHIAVQFWCGMVVSSHDRHLTFTSNPSDDAILCERCETNATRNGLPTADELVGRHVHKGKVVPVVTCCSTSQAEVLQEIGVPDRITGHTPSADNLCFGTIEMDEQLAAIQGAEEQT